MKSKDQSSPNQNSKNTLNQLSSNSHYIGPQHQAPDFMKKIHITQGYRINYQCPKQLTKTLLKLHNQTINIWTHLLPAIYIVLSLIYILLATYFVYQQKHLSTQFLPFLENVKHYFEFNHFNLFNSSLSNECSSLQYLYQIQQQLSSIKVNNTNQNNQKYQTIVNQTYDSLAQWPIYMFLVAAAFCLFCSALYHLFYPLSKKSHVMFNRLDVSGVFLLISSSGNPILYYGMYCQFQIASTYIIISIICAIGLFIVSLTNWFYLPPQSFFRVASCVSFGIYGLVPLFHMIIDDAWFDDHKLIGQFNIGPVAPYIFGFAASYLSGVYIFYNKIPQRFKPGSFNIFGHSHQIWHCSVVLGVIVTYRAIILAYNLRLNSLCYYK